MRTFRKVAALQALCITLLMASKPLPYWGEICAVHLIRDAAQAGGSRIQAAELLERIAIGTMAAAPEGIEASAGFPELPLRSARFAAEPVRVAAFQALGELSALEVLDFLQHLRGSDIGADASHHLWHAAQAAVFSARALRVPEGSGRDRFAENALAGRDDAARAAAEMLCERGRGASLPLVAEYLNRVYSGRTAQEEVAFCEGRIRVLNARADETEALAAFLTLDRSAEDWRLTGWAINRLWQKNSPKADAELRRFAGQFDGLAPSSSKVSELLSARMIIRDLPPRSPGWR